MPHGMTAQAAQAVIAAFNDTYPPGSPVLLVLDSGKCVQTKTDAPAAVTLGGSNAAVSLVGSGWYRLGRVIPLPRKRALTGETSAETLRSEMDELVERGAEAELETAPEGRANMNATYLLGQLNDRFQDLTPHRDRRGYVGMSGIGGCLHDLYMRAIHSIPADDRLKWYGFTGQLHEAAVKLLLGLDAEAIGTLLGYTRPDFEIIAGFDDRYRGHIDTRLVRDNCLIEVKSTGWSKFKQRRLQPDPRHVAQVQAYMDHGAFDHAILVYIARDAVHRELFQPALPFWCVDVYRDEGMMEHLNARAQYVLAALDGECLPPDCECGYCPQNWSGVE